MKTLVKLKTEVSYFEASNHGVWAKTMNINRTQMV